MHNSRFPRTYTLALSVLVLTSLQSKVSGSGQNVTATETPTTITPDVCNMSLVTSVDLEAEQRHCVCNSQDMDVVCSNMGITVLPPLISFPKGARIASFAGNSLSTIDADTFYHGPDISELDLSYNKIDFVSSKAFLAFKNLKRLDLSHNRLWNLPTSVFQGLGGLRRLDLSYNDLESLFPETLATLNELRELVLEANPLHELSPKEFQHLQMLETLNLESTMLKVLPDHIFVFTPKLKVLKLANNQLTDVPTEALQVLDQLKTLDLSSNLIEVIEPESFHGLKRLVNLHLDRMPMLTRIEKYAFGDMIQLQELHCSYNFLLTDIDANAFVRKKTNEKVSLSQLFLRQNELTTVPQFLLNWDSGMELHIRDNPLTCDCTVEWMVNMKLKNNFQSDAKCYSPSELQGLSLSELKNQDLVCGMHLAEVVMIACAVVTALLIITLIVAFLVWRRSYSGYRKPYFNTYYGNKHINDMDYRAGDDDI